MGLKSLVIGKAWIHLRMSSNYCSLPLEVQTLVSVVIADEEGLKMTK